MNVWSHLSTIFNRRHALQLAVILALCVALTTTLFFGALTTHAAEGTNQTIGFQGRLLDSNGNVVADGFYNIQFKIYQDGTGTTAGDTGGTLKWTETYVNNGGNNGVEVKNGYLSVNLGSRTAFGSSVDWNQDTLWLSMNVAGSSTSCSTYDTSPCVADGEMLPMKRLTTTPYALNSAKLGGISASGFIQNGTTAQTGDFNVSGTGIASTLQGNTSVISPLFDSTASGTLSIGSTNAATVTIGSATSDQTISIGTGTGVKTLAVGSLDSTSYTKLQGGSQGVRIDSAGGFVVHNNGINNDTLAINNGGDVSINLPSTSTFVINNGSSQKLLEIKETGQITTLDSSSLYVGGTANFAQGLTIQGGGSLRYTTPNGYDMSTAINIPNYTVPAYSSVMAFGLPSSSDATARGILIADARTGSHQATIGVLSPDESNIMGFSWNGSTTTGTLANTANSLALQGNGLNLLTATNNSGSANVGIGNAATSGYALDVTGTVNSSNQYNINGSTALTSTALSFSGASTSVISSAGSQALTLDGKAGVNIQTNGVTRAAFSDANIQIGDGDGSGTPTLLTLDKATTAPTVSSAYLGSMYYDTTLGAVQCYEASGWGNCSNAPDTFVSLSPEYSGAVLNGSTSGTLNSDICSDDLNINDGSASQPTVCGTNETYNFYSWTSPSATTQTKTIYVSYKLPANFKEFVNSATSVLGKTDSSNASVSYQVYRNAPGASLASCGTLSVSTGSQTTWQKASLSGGSDLTNCSFAAGDTVLFKVSLGASNDANAYASNIEFAYKSNN